MIDEANLYEYYYANKSDISGKFCVNEWIAFYKEWVDACNRIRANAGKVKKHGR